MQWLKSQGADINAKDKNGETSLSLVKDEKAKEWLRAIGAR